MPRPFLRAAALTVVLGTTTVGRAQQTTIYYAYDALGRLVISDVRSPRSGGYAAGYGFDASSNRTVYSNATVAYTGQMPTSTSLAVGQSVISSDGRYRLGLQFDGNLVLYAGPTQPLWATMSFNPSSAHLDMQYDGNLVLYEGGQPIWASHTEGHANASLVVQTNGTLAVLDGNGQVLWSSA